MNAKTLTALRGSIRKWQKIVKGTGEDEGTGNCPLCRLFFWLPNDCRGCPVREKTGEKECRGTPYSQWKKGGYVWLDKLSKEAKEHAQDEVDFLRSLLPKKAAKK